MVVPNEFDNETLLLQKTMCKEMNSFSKGIKPLTEEEFRKDYPWHYNYPSPIQSNNRSRNSNYDFDKSTNENSFNTINNSSRLECNRDKEETFTCYIATPNNNNSNNNNNNNNHNTCSNNTSNSTIDSHISKFTLPKKVALKKDRFEINLNTVRGLSNKVLSYNKNDKNKRDYLQRDKKRQRHSYKSGRLQKKEHSLVIRNPFSITHDIIINNILELFHDRYKVIYIMVAFEGREAVIEDKNYTNSNSTNTTTTTDTNINITNNKSKGDPINHLHSIPSTIDITNNNNNTNNSNNNTNNNNTTNDSNDDNDIDIIDITDTDTNTTINNNNTFTKASPYDTSPHFHVLFKTERIIDITDKTIFDMISYNNNIDEKKRKGSVFFINTSKEKLNQLSYITKGNNVKTWGKVPKITPPKVKTGDDVATKIMGGVSVFDIMRDRPGYALINLKKIKEFEQEFKLLTIMNDVKPWDMLLINIKDFNEKELQIFEWMIGKLPIVMLTNERAIVPLSDPQIYIYGGINAGKTTFSEALRERLPHYDFNENNCHNLYNDDLVFLVIKDEFKGGPIPVSVLNQFLDGQKFTLNTKGSVLSKTRNQPCMFFSNFHIFNIYSRIIESNSVIEQQLKKRFTFIDLGEYRYPDNTNDKSLHGYSIHKLFNISNSIKNMDDQSYEECEKHFIAKFEETLLEKVYNLGRISGFTISKILRYKHEKLKTEGKGNRLSVHDMKFLKKMSEISSHCEELLNDIHKEDKDLMEIEKDDQNIKDDNIIIDENSTDNENKIMEEDTSKNDSLNNNTDCSMNNFSNTRDTNNNFSDTRDPVSNFSDTSTDTIDKYTFIPGISSKNNTVNDTKSNNTSNITSMHSNSNNNNNSNNILPKKIFIFDDISLDDTF